MAPVNSLIRIKLEVEPTLATCHTFAFLPQHMAGVATMGLVKTGSLDERLGGGLIDAFVMFVYTAATLGTS